MTLFIAVIANNWGRVFVPGMNLADGTRHVNTGGGGRAFASLLSVSVTLLFLLHFPSFLVGGVAVFGL